MKTTRWLKTALLSCLLAALSVGVSAQEERPAPEFFLLEYKSGEKKTFKDILLTKANVLVVTETTCVSCIKELKALDWLRAKYKGDMAVIAVFIDRQGEPRVERYLHYYDFDLDMFLIDPGQEVPADLGVDYIPTMIIFDRKGREIHRKRGFDEGDESAISAMVEEIIYPRKKRAAPAPKAEGEEVTAPRVRTAGCATRG